MKYIVYTDSDGYTRRVLVKDDDDETKAPYGIPAGPPDMRSLDWDGVARTINNVLADMEVFTWDDWQKNPGAANASLNIVKHALIAIFREEHNIRRVKE
jgi:hypothetical protein